MALKVCLLVLFVLVGRLVSRSITDRIGRRYERIVNQNHRVVNEKRILLVSLHEIAKEVAKDVRAVLVHVVFGRLKLAIAFQWWTPEPLTRFLFFCQLPKTVFIEADLMRPGVVFAVPAGCCTGRSVATCLQLPSCSPQTEVDSQRSCS